MHHQQQQELNTGKKLQINEQTITAAIALPTTKVKSNRALTLANFLCGDSSSVGEDLEKPGEASCDAVDGQIECFKAEKLPLLNKKNK